jgi:rhomboid protease GluP
LSYLDLVLPLILFVGVVLWLVLRKLEPEERLQLVRKIVHLARQSVPLARDVITHIPKGSEDFFTALRERTRWTIVTPALIVTYVVVHMLMRMDANSTTEAQMLVDWGASLGPRTTNNEWWRLGTSIFVHWSWLHVIANAAGLAIAGALVERLVGRAAFLLVYMAAGVLAAVWALAAHPVAIGAGAAGSVFGVYGLLIATLIWGFLQRSPLTIPLAALKRIWPGAVIFLVYTITTEGLISEPMKAGLCVGVLGGLILAARVSASKPPVGRVCATMVATLALVIIYAAPLRGLADVTAEVARVIDLEERTAATYDTQVNHFKRGRLTAERLASIAEGIESEIHTTRTELTALRNIPEEHRQLLIDCLEYLRLREESWHLRVEGLRAGRMQILQRAERRESEALTAFEKVEKLKSGKVEK